MKRPLQFLLTILILSCNSIEEKILQEEDLQELTLVDLRILRNEIFAKHGYIFKSRDLTNYFSKFDWYNPINNNVDSLLTEIDREKIKLILKVENENKKFVINTDQNTVEKYKRSLTNSNKQFVEKTIKTIANFKDKKADTTIIQICNIQNTEKKDTIKNRIYYFNNNVIVNSTWSKSGERMWEYEIENPYLWISDSDEFQYDTREPWVTFTIGIYYAIPEIRNIVDYSHIDKEIILRIGLDWATRKDIKISKKEYSKYLDNFKGDIIAYGDPENREGLIIWYEPIKDFVLFYTP